MSLRPTQYTTMEADTQRSVANQHTSKPQVGRQSLTTDQKCRIILERMMHVTREGDDIILRHNEEGNCVTVYVGFGRKTCGAEDATFEELVNDLYRLFNKQYGLSFQNLHHEEDWDTLEPPPLG